MTIFWQIHCNNSHLRTPRAITFPLPYFTSIHFEDPNSLLVSIYFPPNHITVSSSILPPSVFFPFFPYVLQAHMNLPSKKPQCHSLSRESFTNTKFNLMTLISSAPTINKGKQTPLHKDSEHKLLFTDYKSTGYQVWKKQHKQFLSISLQQKEA